METFNFQRAFESIHSRLDGIAAEQARTSTHINGLIGNGQPGRITNLETAVQELKDKKSEARGALWAFGLIGTAIEVGAHWIFRGK